MKKLELTRNDVVLLFLFTVGFILLFAGIFLKSLLASAGAASIIVAWFLCIDNIIVNHKMNFIKLIIFGSIILFLPLFFALYMGA